MAQGPEQRMWTNQIRPYLRAESMRRGLYYAKLHGSAYQAGLPDLLVSIREPTGKVRTAYFELKAPGKWPTAKQAATAVAMLRGGLDVLLATTLEDVQAWADDRWTVTCDRAKHGTVNGELRRLLLVSGGAK